MTIALKDLKGFVRTVFDRARRLADAARIKSRSSANPSLTVRSSLWCAAAVLAYSILAGGVIFATSYFEAKEAQDERLSEVSGIILRSRVSFNRRDPDFNALYMDDSKFEEKHLLDDDDPRAVIPAGTEIIIQTLHKTGRSLRYRTREDFRDGFHDLEVNGVRYRVLSKSLSRNRHVVVAERASRVFKQACVISLNLLMPFLLLSVLLSLGIWLLLRRMFRPVRTLAAEVASRSGESLSPMPVSGVPDELVPLIRAFNDLLARVEALRDQEARFVADAAHELRSPLAALSLQAERMEREDLSPAARAQLSTLRAGIGRAVRQVSQLLALKRAQARSARKDSDDAPPPRAGVVAAVNEAVQSVYWEAERLGVTIEVAGVEELPEGAEPMLPMAFDDLFTILRNLLENAVRYSPSGTTVTLELANPSDPVLTVSDCGPGIPADERARVLEPFYRRLGTGVAGTGLGLAIVKTLCDRWELSLSLADARSEGGLAPGLAVTVKRR